MIQKFLEFTGWPLKRSSTIIFFYAVLLIGAFVATRKLNVTSTTGPSIRKALPVSSNIPTSLVPKKTAYPLECLPGGVNVTQTCPSNYPTTFQVAINETTSNPRVCPDYFKWLHEDLQPWKSRGISKEMVEAAKEFAYFRLVVVDGKAYMEKYRDAYQTRDIFTVWGIVQLLRLYPGKLPDLDLMFECGDKPVIHKDNYTRLSFEDAPPLFHYCGDDYTLDIVFPDWSFWGWPEINIKPWDSLKKDLKEGTKRVQWTDRLPFAFWKGNLFMGDRMKLADCNSTRKWHAQIFLQDWEEETKLGFKTSELAEQCRHRYKIYIEGIAWSVSEKYILACDSMALLVTPQWYEFFTRSLLPMKHYWPINPNNLCKSIKHAVDWGNHNTQKARKIGKTATKFVQQELTMNNVYDYMFHLLKEYGKLLRYKPTIPPGAVEVCSETLACTVEGQDRKFKEETLVMKPATRDPCIMPPPQEPHVVKSFLDKQDDLRKRVDMVVANHSLQESFR